MILSFLIMANMFFTLTRGARGTTSPTPKPCVMAQAWFEGGKEKKQGNKSRCDPASELGSQIIGFHACWLACLRELSMSAGFGRQRGEVGLWDLGSRYGTCSGRIPGFARIERPSWRVDESTKRNCPGEKDAPLTAWRRDGQTRLGRNHELERSPFTPVRFG